MKMKYVCKFIFLCYTDIPVDPVDLILQKIMHLQYGK